MIGNLTVLAIIPARGGSTRIPHKNIKLLGGKPLIAWTIETAKAARTLDRVICSTDDESIAQIARERGAEVPFMRPKELGGNEVTDYSVFEHALAWLAEHEGYKPDIVVQLRPTSPLRTAAHIDTAVELLAAHPEADSVRTVTEPDQSPYKMYKINAAGLLEPLMSIEGAKESFNLPGQILPAVFKHVGYVDAVWSRTLNEKKKMTGDIILPLVLKDAYSGIDTPEDWNLYEHLISRS